VAKLVSSLSLTAKERERKEQQENQMILAMTRKESMKRQSQVLLERSDTIKRRSIKVVNT